MPVSGIVFGVTFAFVESERVPVATPAAEGAKVTVKFTDWPLDKVKGRAGPT